MSKSSNKILEVAEQLFNEYGYTSVGVDLIRDVSKTSKSTMYTYFKSKNQLINEVLKRRDVNFRTSLRSFVMNEEYTDIERISKLFEWHFNWFKSASFNGCMFIKVALDLPRDDKSALVIAMQHKIWLQRFITETLREAKDNKLMAELIFNVLEGLINRFLVFGFDEAIASYSLDSVLRIYGFTNNAVP